MQRDEPKAGFRFPGTLRWTSGLANGAIDASRGRV
jgi:hypothetical protein